MRLVVLFAITFLSHCLFAVEKENIPELLVSTKGKKIVTVQQWEKTRRPEILELFRQHVYGRMPVDKPQHLTFETVEQSDTLFNSQATRKVVKISYSGVGGSGSFLLTLYIPNKATKPLPGFLFICHRNCSDLAKNKQFWPVNTIIKRGFMTAMISTPELDPDVNDGFKNGVHGIFDKQPRTPDAWGTIAAWSWGARRAMDYFETDKTIDAKHIAVLGHSRGAKAALWAGAEDQRFALVISNNSGSTGAAMARGKKGESIKDINTSFPHWFSESYKQYNNNEDKLPVDQHQLIALIAPRLVYVASGSADNWADPASEFKSCVYAEPAYKLYGLNGLETQQMPKPSEFIHTGNIGYHLREGKHNLTEFDWNLFMKFAEMNWMK